MKAKLEITVKENDQIDVELNNPGGVDLYTIVGILEKVKGEFIIGSPGPSYQEGEQP